MKIFPGKKTVWTVIFKNISKTKPNAKNFTLNEQMKFKKIIDLFTCILLLIKQTFNLHFSKEFLFKLYKTFLFLHIFQIHFLSLSFIHVSSSQLNVWDVFFLDSSIKIFQIFYLFSSPSYENKVEKEKRSIVSLFSAPFTLDKKEVKAKVKGSKERERRKRKKNICFERLLLSFSLLDSLAFKLRYFDFHSFHWFSPVYI